MGTAAGIIMARTHSIQQPFDTTIGGGVMYTHGRAPAARQYRSIRSPLA
jgi:hypothetical protein